MVAGLIGTMTANEEKDPWIDPTFSKLCTDHAFTTGKGFHEWVYDVFYEIRTSLCDTIQEQTAGVRRGDLVSLINSIKLAVGNYELHDPEALHIEYSKCTMEHEGKNDLMTYLAKLANYRQRLVVAEVIVSDKKAQRVLLVTINFVARLP